MDNKRYNLKKLQEEIGLLITEKNKKFMSFEELLFEIGFDTQDVNKFYIKHIKHRIRYEN